VIRRLARPLLGAAFISSGLEAIKDVDRRASRAQSYGISQPVNATQALAVAQIGGGALLALNRFPRLTSMVLALTVVPVAATGHAFWSEKDGETKAAQRSLFARDLGLLGGLLIASIETGGRESVPHRAARSSKKAAKAAAERVG
jgi:uncharacterized membrane protein YphA (DoxX/SURF4 family)